MSGEQTQCRYIHTDKTNGTKTPCQHPVYGKESVCVFHSEKVREKAADFDGALNRLLDHAVASREPVDLNFQGFIFPQADFRRVEFRGHADFREAVFTSEANFRNARFLRQADFHKTEFRARVDFHATVFESIVRFLGTRFLGRATFNGCKFRGRTAFHGCKFFDFASWQASKFEKSVPFQSDEFIADADFRHVTFYDGVNFWQTLFHQKAHFEDTRFHGEVNFSETHLAFLKKLNCPRANMDGAVLHTAQIWENKRLVRYSFRNAFLLSVNLSGRELEDCDFTGAVFKAVLTVGWKPDRKTQLNTKYIYTDYESQEIQSANGTKLRVYRAVISSRVPAVGNFGEGEHENFTVADYVRERPSIPPPKPVIYVSYAWADENATPDDQQREELVDSLCQKIKASGREIGRDRTHMRAGDSIARFAQEISKAERIVAVISAKSLRSEYCMVHELFSAFRRCNYDCPDFQKKVVALEMDDAKADLKDALSRGELARFWLNLHKTRRALLEEVDPEHKSPNAWAILDAMEDMCPRLFDMLGAIKDIVMKRGFNEIVNDEFNEVLTRLPPLKSSPV